MRNPLMISAAVVSSRRVLRIRPAGRSGSSFGPPLTSGITDTPVSNPDRPRASLGNTTSATATANHQLPRSASNALDQSPTRCASVNTCRSATTTTTAFSAR
jgi:hypothetical protein